MSTQTVKKTKATAKSETAAKLQDGEGAVKAAPRVAAKKTVKASSRTKTADVATTHTPSHTKIAQLAERFWAVRGLA
jgi:hypothetical protein